MALAYRLVSAGDRHDRPSKRPQTSSAFLRGCLYFNNRRSSLDCLIRDISASGARLIFSDTVTIPDVVDLYIPQKEQTLRSQVHWRHGDEIGVAFVHGARASGVPQPTNVGELAERIQKLEGEIAALRKMLKRLKAEIAGDAEEAA
jgi:hypothetical protein